jgi:hypothetical protein
MAVDGPGRTLRPAQSRPGISWVDALLVAIARIPGPLPVAYLAILVVGSVAVLVARALAGAPAPTDRDLAVMISTEVSIPVVFLASLHGLEVVARRTVATVRPALALDDAGVAALLHDLTRTPRPAALVAVGSGAVAGLASVLSAPTSYMLVVGGPAYPWAEAIAFSMAASALALAFVVRAAQQLRTIRAATRELVAVDIYRLQPLYGFATLTSWTGIALIAIVVYGLFAVSLAAPGGQVALSATDLATLAVILLVATASFIGPLLGLHERIVAARDAELTRAMEALRTAIDFSNRRIGEAATGDLAAAKNGIDAATASIAAIRGISTWPWRPETFRGFVSALGIPLVLWVLQNAVLRRLLS